MKLQWKSNGEILIHEYEEVIIMDKVFYVKVDTDGGIYGFPSNKVEPLQEWIDVKMSKRDFDCLDNLRVDKSKEFMICGQRFKLP